MRGLINVLIKQHRCADLVEEIILRSIDQKSNDNRFMH